MSKQKLNIVNIPGIKDISDQAAESLSGGNFDTLDNTIKSFAEDIHNANAQVALDRMSQEYSANKQKQELEALASRSKANNVGSNFSLI